MNEARLKIIDRLLRKGWQSYYDIARVIHNDPGDFGKMKRFSGTVEEGECYYESFLASYRSSIAQDFMDILNIWTFSRRGKVSPKGESTAKKDPLRAEARSEVFDIKEQRQFSGNRVQELYIPYDKSYKPNPKVQFFRYKNPDYSVFGSGEYARFIAFKAKKRTRSVIDRSLRTTVSDNDVHNVLYDPDVILEPKVSEQIKHSIRLQEELREFARESRIIVENLLLTISTASEQKKRSWVRKTINNYRNILEIVKNPLSNYNPREIASSIHDFAFFLASENQYHILGNKFEEALSIYQKLQKELSLSGELNTSDNESVASILLSMARVNLDSGKIDKAQELVEQACSLTSKDSPTLAVGYHIQSLIEALKGNYARSVILVDDALSIMSARHLEASPDTLSMLLSKAELLHKSGDAKRACLLYQNVIETADRDTGKDIMALALMNLALIELEEKHLDDADKTISEAVVLYKALFDSEPDKYLPNLLSAYYISGLVSSQKGDFSQSIATMEVAVGSIPSDRPDLVALCASELLEIYISLQDLYRAEGESQKAEKAASAALSLLSHPSVILSSQQRTALLERLNGAKV